MANTRDLNYQLANLNIDLDLARTELQIAQAGVTRYQNLANSQPGNPVYQAGLRESAAAVAAANAKIASIQGQISGLSTTASAGEVANNKSTGNTATTQANVTANNSPYVSTNGTGTGSTLSGTNSQGTPAGNPNRTGTNGVNTTPKQTVGASAPREDGTAPNTNVVQQIVNKEFAARIDPLVGPR